MNPGFEALGGSLSGWNTIGLARVVNNTYGSTILEGTYQGLIETGDERILPPFLGESSDPIEDALHLERNALDDLVNFGSASPVASEGAQVGSVIYQDFTVVAGEKITFKFNFLTNESQNQSLFNDLAFISVVDIAGPKGTFLNMDVLAQTYDPLTPFLASPDYLNQTGGPSTGGRIPNQYTHEFATAGTYRFGLGVVNVNDRTNGSGLLIDAFSSSNNDPVPEPGTIAIWSLLAVGGVGFAARRKMKKK